MNYETDNNYNRHVNPSYFDYLFIYFQFFKLSIVEPYRVIILCIIVFLIHNMGKILWLFTIWCSVHGIRSCSNEALTSSCHY